MYQQLYRLKSICLTVMIICFGIQVGWTQRLATFDKRLKSFEDGEKLYHEGVYAAAKDKMHDFLYAEKDIYEYIPDRMRMEAEFYFAAASLKLNQPGADEQLLAFVKKHKPDPFTIQASIEIADYYFYRKDYSKALEYYNMLPDLSNSDAHRDIKFREAYSLLVSKKFSQARALFEILLKKEYPKYIQVAYYHAMCQYYLDEYDRALEEFRGIENSRLYESTVPFYISQIMFIRGEYEEMVDYAEEALQSRQRYKEKIQSLLGQALFKLERYDEALPYLEANTEMEELSDENTYQIAYALYRSGKYERAAGFFENLGLLKGEMGQNANFHLADCLLKTGNRKQARLAFANASKDNFNPEIQEEANFNYGKLSAEMSYDREAINALSSVPTHSDFHEESQNIMADVFLTTVDYSGSIKKLESLALNSSKLRQTYQNLCLKRAKQLIVDGKEEDALKVLDKSLSRPENKGLEAEALYWKGNMKHRREEYEQSIGLLLQFFKTVDNSSDKNLSPVIGQAHYIQAYNYFKREDYSSAGAHFVKSISAMKSSSGRAENIKKQIADAELRLGDIQFSENAYQAATNHYKSAIPYDKSSSDYASFQLALIEGLRENFTNKVLLLRNLIVEYPKSEYKNIARLEMAKTLMDMGQMTDAIAPLRAIINENGRNELLVEAHLSLGLIAYNQGDVQSALKYYKKIFDLNADNESKEEARTAIEEIYIRDLSDPDGYLEFVKGSGGRIPENSGKDSLTYRTAEIAYNAGEDEKAIRLFSSYLRKYPNGFHAQEAYFKRADAHARKKEYGSALKDYEKLIQLGEGSFYSRSLKNAALIAYHEEEGFDKAEKYYKLLSQQQLSESDIHTALRGGIQASYRSPEREELHYFSSAIITSPLCTDEDKATAYYYRGKTFLRDGEQDEALSAFNKVTEYSDNEYSAEARYRITEIYFENGELALAESLARRSYQENGDYPVWVAHSLLLLSDILILKEDYFNARAALEAIIDNFTEDEDLLERASQKHEELLKLAGESQAGEEEFLEMDEN